MNNIQFDESIYKKLSPRELEAARLAKEGFDCKGAADLMGITKSTVGNLRARAMKKLGCKTMTKAVVSLIDAGIL